MAARLELYRLADGEQMERISTPAEGSFLGFVSASDDDEETLFETLEAIAARGGIEPIYQGDGDLPLEGVRSLAAIADVLVPADVLGGPARDDTLHATVAGWLATIAQAAQAAVGAGRPLGWRMRYDRGGTTDDGPDEFPTDWSAR